MVNTFEVILGLHYETSCPLWFLDHCFDPSRQEKKVHGKKENWYGGETISVDYMFGKFIYITHTNFSLHHSAAFTFFLTQICSCQSLYILYNLYHYPQQDSQLGSMVIHMSIQLRCWNLDVSKKPATLGEEKA